MTILAAILDITQNAMSKFLSDYTTMSGLPQNPGIDHPNHGLPRFCRKLNHFNA